MPEYDQWGYDLAKKMYDQAHFEMSVDVIHFQDCIEGMKPLASQSIDLVIADPPFGINFSGKESYYNRDESYVISNYVEIDSSDYEDFTHQWVAHVARLMKPTASFYFVSGWSHLRDALNALHASGLTLLNHIIWKYPFGVYSQAKKFVSSHYHILLAVKDLENYYFNKVDHYPLDVWEISRNYKKKQPKNGTKLPEDVVDKMIHYSSKPGDVVLDPFMGNGTTAACAVDLFRHYMGFEINKELTDLILDNTQQWKPGGRYPQYLIKPTTQSTLLAGEKKG